MERLTVPQVHNEEDRHRVKIQTHTLNKEQMLIKASQVIYIKYYFIWETVVEWVYCWNAWKSDVTASLLHFYSAFHWSAQLVLSKKGFFIS